LKLNNKKIHVNRPHNKMMVNGVIVNEKTNIDKRKYRNLRAKLHNLQFKGAITKEEAMQLRGNIEWIRNLNPQKAQNLMNQFGLLNVKDS
jgi:hypothetical protein